MLLAELRETSSQSEHDSIGPLVARGLGFRCSTGRRGLALLRGTVYFRFFLWGALCGGPLGVDHFCERWLEFWARVNELARETNY